MQLSISYLETAKVPTYCIVAADLTERIKAEDALRRAYDESELKVQERTKELSESESKYRNIVETANEGIMMATPEGQVSFANERMAQLLGYSIEELVGKSGLELVPEEDRVAGRKDRDAQRRGQRNLSTWMQRKDGQRLLLASQRNTTLR